MAYTEEQKRNHVRELQTFLHGLSHTGNLPHVIPDGFYGAGTAQAVRQFQQQNQMPPTGETDTATWDALSEAFQREVRIPTTALSIFPTGINAYFPNDTGTAILILQAVLQAIQRQFPHLPSVKSSGVYDEPTTRAVRQFQQHTNAEPTGVTDRHTWNLLLAAIAPQLTLIRDNT